MPVYTCSVSDQYYIEYELDITGGSFKLSESYSDGAGGWAGPKRSGSIRTIGNKVFLKGKDIDWEGHWDGDSLVIDNVGTFIR